MVWGPNVANAGLLYNVNLFASSLSLFGSLCMTYFACRMPSPKTVSSKFIIGIALADIAYSIINLVSSFETESMNSLCYAESILRIWAKESSLFFAACIAILCYKSSRYGRKFNQDRFFKRALIFGTVACTLLTSAPLYLTEMVAYTNGDLFCYITYVPSASLPVKIGVRLVYEVLLFFTGLSITMYGYFKTVRYIRKYSYQAMTHMDVSIYKLYWYPLVIFFTFMPSVVNNLVKIYYKESFLVIEIIHLALTHSIGFTNAVVYGIQRRLYVSDSSDDNDEAEGDDAKQYHRYFNSAYSTENELVKANSSSVDVSVF